MEEGAGELAVVGWLSGQCVTLGWPGVRKREVSCGQEASGAHTTHKTHLTSPIGLFGPVTPVNHLLVICNIHKRFLHSFPLWLSLFPSVSSLVEDWVGGGGLLAFLHRVLCARPGLGSSPYPLFTLSRFPDYHPSSSPLKTLPSLFNLFNSPWLLPQPLLLPATLFCSSQAFHLRSLLLLSPFLILLRLPPIIHSPLSLPLTLFHLSSIPARGSRSSLCDTDVPSCSGHSTWEQSIGGALLLVCFRECLHVCKYVHMREREIEREQEMKEKKSMHSQSLNLVSLVCVSLTFSLKKCVFVAV